MRRALELARLGRGAVEPNPMVGCVLVRDGRIIGEGWHRRFGAAHAEVEALRAAQAAGADPAGATAYVTLEPCCHFGKTPPCTQALIEARVAVVVAAMVDPDTHASGQGLAALAAAGIQTRVGLLEAEARELLAAYIKLRTQHRPWVICKWAQTLDGRIAAHTGHSKWITGEAARGRVYELRGRCDGICVGAGTVLADDPELTNRSGSGRQPARLVLDDALRVPPSCRLLAAPAASPVIIATRQAADSPAAVALARAGAEIMVLPPASPWQGLMQDPGQDRPAPVGVHLGALLDELGRRQWTHLLVEGGRSVLGAFLAQRLADELWVFVAPRILGGPGSLGPVDWPDVPTVDHGLRLPAPEVERVGDDVLLRFMLDNANRQQAAGNGQQ